MDNAFYYNLCVLRVANLSPGGFHPIMNIAVLRGFIRQYAVEFSLVQSVGEVADHILYDPMALLSEDGCLEVRKNGEAYSGDMHNLIYGPGGWSMGLTAKGRALLAQMEDAVKPLRKKKIGFHA